MIRSVMGVKERDGADAFDPRTGLGHVAAFVECQYRDALTRKKNEVRLIMHEQSSGAFNSGANAFFSILVKRSKKKDDTDYGDERTNYARWWSQLIGATVTTANARRGLAQIDSLWRDLARRRTSAAAPALAPALASDGAGRRR